MSVIKVSSNIRNYDVHIEDSPAFLQRLSALPQKVFVIDENVWRNYSGTSLRLVDLKDTIIVPVSEERKNLESVEWLYDQLTLRSAKRNLTLISFGGGIVQDITGFVASTLYRGIRWIFVPTTLLAQADSCIGSKTSLNYKGYKNLIGTFYPPNEVIIHTPFLNSLDNEVFYSGLGEVIKLHMMGGMQKTQELLDLFPDMIKRVPSALNKAIVNALEVKLSYIEGDEFDLGRRNYLNYGHCFGHAIEAVTDFNIPHGQAVVMGMLLANLVAQKRGLLADPLETHLRHKMLTPGLVIPAARFPSDPIPILEAMKKDKKRTGTGLVLIMLMDDYEMTKVNDLSEDEVAWALSALTALVA